MSRASLQPDSSPPVTTVWRAVTKLLAWLVAMTLVCISLAYFKPQLDRQTRIELELAALRAEKSRLSTENHRLKSRLEWLKQDPDFLEILSRDRLDLARKRRDSHPLSARGTPTSPGRSSRFGRCVRALRATGWRAA